MRSSKSRSRSKQNRNRSVGNVINRVFDSSGPEGKVRGTPQQIIDKYNQLARDAQLGNDRVAAENFQQHSEHYTRMLGEAMREMEQQRQNQNQNHNQYQGDNGNNSGNGNSNQGGNNNQNNNSNQGGGNRDQQRSRDDREDRADAKSDQNAEAKSEPQDDRPKRSETPATEQPASELPAFVTQPARTNEPLPSIDFEGEANNEGSGLVETPESAAKPKTSRPRRPRTPKAKPDVKNSSEAAE